VVGGERSTHKPFEAEIAKFLGFESALTLVSGYLANVTTIAWLMGKRDAIFIDDWRITASSPAPTARTPRSLNSATTITTISNICCTSNARIFRHVLTSSKAFTAWTATPPTAATAGDKGQA